MVDLWQDGTLQQIAHQLYEWRGREQLGAKDVALWQRRPGTESGEFGIAFMGDALKMTRHALMRELPNHDYQLDVSLQRALGLPGEVRHRRDGVHAVLQTMSQDRALIDDVLGSVSALAGVVYGRDEAFKSTLMPTPGAPWSPHNTPTTYYSARKGFQTTKRPAYVMKVETREGPALGADFCQLLPTMSHCSGMGIVGGFWKDPSQRFLVTHSVPIFERYGGAPPAQTARSIRDCGGLLLPSLAVGVVPATNFGELVLVADVSLVLPTLKPYKARGAWPVIVYETDVWTSTTREFLGDGAAELLLELTDIAEFMYSPHFWMLGPPIMDAMAAPIGSTQKLRTALKRRAKIWPELLTEAEHEQTMATHTDTVHRYPYLEVKANGILGMDCFPLAVCPRGDTRKHRSFLKGIGFAGELMTVPKPPEIEGRDPDWDYGWAVREAVLAYAEKRPGDRVVNLEE